MDKIIYTDAQATEEALLLLMRKIHRLHPDAYADVITRLPDLARQALSLAELRADTLRASDRREGITRAYPDHLPID